MGSDHPQTKYDNESHIERQAEHIQNHRRSKKVARLPFSKHLARIVLYWESRLEVVHLQDQITLPRHTHQVRDGSLERISLLEHDKLCKSNSQHVLRLDLMC